MYGLDEPTLFRLQERQRNYKKVIYGSSFGVIATQGRQLQLGHLEAKVCGFGLLLFPSAQIVCNFFSVSCIVQIYCNIKRCPVLSVSVF